MMWGYHCSLQLYPRVFPWEPPTYELSRSDRCCVMVARCVWMVKHPRKRVPGSSRPVASGDPPPLRGPIPPVHGWVFAEPLYKTIA